MVFWNLFPMWAKLCFVFGCSIILILVLAIGVRTWKYSREQDYALAEAEQAERGEMIETETGEARQSEDMPFGIRALYEASEVEGVWNARTITPLHIPGTTSTSPILEPTRLLDPDQDSNTSVARPDTSDASHSEPLARRAKTEPLPDLPSTTEDSTDLPEPVIRRSLTVSYSRPRPGFNPAEPKEPAPTPVEPPICDEPNGLAARPSRRRRIVIKSRAHTPPLHLISGLTDEVSEDVIQRMEEHRKSHVAESGQLIPRTSKDGPKHQATGSASSDSQPVVLQKKTTSTSVHTHVSNSLHLTKHLPQKTQQAKGPNFAPLKAKTGASLPKRRAPPSSWTDKTEQFMNDKMATESLVYDRHAGHTPIPSLSSSSTISTSSSSDDASPIRSTQLRKINGVHEIDPAKAFSSLKDSEDTIKFRYSGLLREHSNATIKPQKLSTYEKGKSEESSQSSQSSQSNRSHESKRSMRPVAGYFSVA